MSPDVIAQLILTLEPEAQALVLLLVQHLLRKKQPLVPLTPVSDQPTPTIPKLPG